MDGRLGTDEKREYRPGIVGLGGTMRPGSSTERLLRAVLAEAELTGGRWGGGWTTPLKNGQSKATADSLWE